MTAWILVVLAAEYILQRLFILASRGGSLLSVQELLWLAGYILLTLFITCNNHGGKVRVSHERELSFFFKALMTDLVMLIFVLASSGGMEESGLHKLLAGSGCMIAVQLISIVIICRIYIRLAERAGGRAVRLYIYYKTVPKLDLPAHSELLCIGGTDERVILDRIEHCDEVYLYNLPERIRADIIKLCFLRHKPVYFTCMFQDVELRSAAIAQDGDKLIFCSRNSSAVHGAAAVIKRIADVAGSAVLLVLLSPVFAVIAAAIRADDGGKVFYLQERCTLNQRRFRIIKFRSMVMGAEDNIGAGLAGRNDARLTRVGRILRRTRLDELPQLINILKGDMSFVGPRPERPEIIADTIRTAPEFGIRTMVKAGLTGYAQVHSTYHTDRLEKLKWDLMYIDNFSLLLDFKIILLTIPAILRADDV